MARDEAERPVEAVGVEAALVRAELDEAAATLPGAADGVKHELPADSPTAHRPVGTPGFDMRPGHAMPRQAGGVGELKADEDPAVRSHPDQPVVRSRTAARDSTQVTRCPKAE